MKKTGLIILTMVVGLMMLPGCVRYSTHIRNQVETPVETMRSELHDFTLISVREDDGELVIWGNVQSQARYCLQRPRVDLAIVDAEGGVLESVGMPIVNRGRRGNRWFSANFRTRVPAHSGRRAEIRLAIRDDGCSSSETFAISDNRAMTHASASTAEPTPSAE